MALFEVRGLTHFFGGLRAVSDFNLTFEGGELMGLIGPNGAGKTTIFNLICGVYHPTQGEVRIEGRNLVRRYPHQVTAMGVARTFQNIRLWPEMTVLDNIRVAHNYKLSYGFLDAIFQTSRYRREENGIIRGNWRRTFLMASSAKWKLLELLSSAPSCFFWMNLLPG
jgi:branched-chain amino acid transport system ATP-binding protein